MARVSDAGHACPLVHRHRHLSGVVSDARRLAYGSKRIMDEQRRQPTPCAAMDISVSTLILMAVVVADWWSICGMLSTVELNPRHQRFLFQREPRRGVQQLATVALWHPLSEHNAEIPSIPSLRRYSFVNAREILQVCCGPHA